MRLRNWIVSVVLLAELAGATGFVLAREPDSQSAVTSQQLFAEVMAREPGKEVNAQAYTFAPGAVLPWHIHPDAHEIAYVVEGDFSFQIEGEPVKQLKAGEAAYLRPNVVHRGMNKSDKPVKLFVVRIKPKDAPLVVEVPAPPQ
jgi:quercetin dioxygenase-like cupin family protein